MPQPGGKAGERTCHVHQVGMDVGGETVIGDAKVFYVGSDQFDFIH